MCIDCAGCHRKLGTHISKVKSTTLDQWSLPEVEVNTFLSFIYSSLWKSTEILGPTKNINIPRPITLSTTKQYRR